MALYFIGIGLSSVKDISVRGLEAIKKCNKIYLEYYTSKLSQNTVQEIKEYYNKDIIIADRTLVEQKAEETILKDAKSEDTAFLVIGDIFSATTHIDLMTRAKKEGIECKFIHNASVISAVGMIGLEIYKYGRALSIPFNNENITSPYERYLDNKKMGLHTLFLLDLDPPNDKFMSIKEGVDFLLRNGLDKDTIVIGCAGLGSEKAEIKAFKASEVAEFTLYPQCFVIPGNLHFMEEEMIESWK